MVVRMSGIMLLVYGGFIGLTYFGFLRVPTGFIPPQDKGYLIVDVQMPEGASLDRTDGVIQQATKNILSTPGVTFAVSFAGFSAATFSNN
jgi:hydrophobic/amphiphilic exporter-1 (mainly G- bacteria), HAE1 family